MNRRRFLALLGGTALVPFVAPETSARPAMPSASALRSHLSSQDQAFLEGMRQTVVQTLHYTPPDDTYCPKQFAGYGVFYDGDWRTVVRRPIA